MFRFHRVPALALALLASTSAFATVVIAQTLEELTAAAPVIVRGRVVSAQTRWDDEHHRINTYAEVVRAEALKGSAPEVLLVRQPGGEVGPVGQRVAGAASFVVGEEVVLFLESAPDEAGVFGVYTMAAGKVGFETSALGQVRAVRHLEGLVFYERNPAAPRFRAVGADDLGTPEEFLLRVRRAVAKEGAGR
jgi:hypothetical protein